MSAPDAVGQREPASEGSRPPAGRSLVMSDDSLYGIGDVIAALADDFPEVTISKVRFLETEGLITPERTASGYRKFRSSDIDRLRYVLTMLGKRCVLLDPSGGLATHMARAIGKTDVLLAISFRFYASEVVNIVNETAGRKVPVIAITPTELTPTSMQQRINSRSLRCRVSRPETAR